MWNGSIGGLHFFLWAPPLSILSEVYLAYDLVFIQDCPLDTSWSMQTNFSTVNLEVGVSMESNIFYIASEIYPLRNPWVERSDPSEELNA